MVSKIMHLLFLDNIISFQLVFNLFKKLHQLNRIIDIFTVNH